MDKIPQDELICSFEKCYIEGRWLVWNVDLGCVDDDVGASTFVDDTCDHHLSICSAGKQDAFRRCGCGCGVGPWFH